MGNVLVAQMLYLANEDPEADITLYINSPGGSVSAGMAIYDTMQFIPCDVSTVCFGMAASMGAFLLGAGAKGKRKSLPNARIMIHQPLGGAQGQAADALYPYPYSYSTPNLSPTPTPNPNPYPYSTPTPTPNPNPSPSPHQVRIAGVRLKPSSSVCAEKMRAPFLVN